jgi:hypothetical protein
MAGGATIAGSIAVGVAAHDGNLVSIDRGGVWAGATEDAGHSGP